MSDTPDPEEPPLPLEVELAALFTSVKPSSDSVRVSFVARSLKTPVVTPDVPAAASEYEGDAESTASVTEPVCTVIVPPVALPNVSVTEDPETTPVVVQFAAAVLMLETKLSDADTEDARLHLRLSVLTEPFGTTSVLSKVYVVAEPDAASDTTFPPVLSGVAPSNI